MQQKNNSPQRKYVRAALGTAAVVLGTGYAFLGPGLLPAGTYTWQFADSEYWEETSI